MSWGAGEYRVATIIHIPWAPGQEPDKFFHTYQLDGSFEQLCEVRGVLPVSEMRPLRFIEGEMTCSGSPGWLGVCVSNRNVSRSGIVSPCLLWPKYSARRFAGS